jgi:UPF0755 protein
VSTDPNWNQIFGTQPGTAGSPPQGSAAYPAPQTRRELREAEARTAGGSGASGNSGAGSSDNRGNRPSGPKPPKRKRRLAWLWVLITVFVIGAAGAFAAWTLYEEQVREVLGWQLPIDYEGAGNGEEVIVVIQSGDIGSDVAHTLEEAGVTMTFKAFYDLLLVQDPPAQFQPGNYALQAEMSAQSALDALNDPTNKIINKVLIPEGTAAPEALVLISSGTGIPVAELEAAAADYVALGVPAEAPSIEGFLFPATYTFDPGVTATEVLQQLVNETIRRLDAKGVAPEDRFRIVTLASIIQRESGPNVEDMFKISRVFTNRLATPGWKLESDATVAYGTGNTHTVWTTNAERADASNLYNTYLHEGLPIGPIGLPGDNALDAAISPTEGPWFFFVPINLKTGETVFSETSSQHEAAASQLRQWCRASDENAAYCE